MPTVYFISGAVALGYVVAAIFFLKFWKRTADVLFLSFAVAFALLSIGKVVVASVDIYADDSSAAYLVRLGAFAIIILAVWRKNRPSR